MRKEHSAPLQALIWLLKRQGQAEAGFLPQRLAPLPRMRQRSEGEDISCTQQPVHTQTAPAPRPRPDTASPPGSWQMGCCRS